MTQPTNDEVFDTVLAVAERDKRIVRLQIALECALNVIDSLWVEAKQEICAPVVEDIKKVLYQNQDNEFIPIRRADGSLVTKQEWANLCAEAKKLGLASYQYRAKKAQEIFERFDKEVKEDA